MTIRDGGLLFWAPCRECLPAWGHPPSCGSHGHLILMPLILQIAV